MTTFVKLSTKNYGEVVPVFVNVDFIKEVYPESGHWSYLDENGDELGWSKVNVVAHLVADTPDIKPPKPVKPGVKRRLV